MGSSVTVGVYKVTRAVQDLSIGLSESKELVIAICGFG